MSKRMYCNWDGANDFGIMLNPGAPCGTAMFGANVQLLCSAGLGTSCPTAYVDWSFCRLDSSCNGYNCQHLGCLAGGWTAGCASSSTPVQLCYSPIKPLLGWPRGNYICQLSIYQLSTCGNLIVNKNAYFHCDGFGNWTSIGDPCAKRIN